MNKRQVDLCGIFLPLTTPFDQSGNLDLNNLSKNVQNTNNHEFIKAVVVLSTVGEEPYLSSEERCRVVQTAKQNLRENRPLIAGSGRQGTKLTIDLCNRLADAGADAVLVHPPSFYANMMHPKALENHYRQVADQCKVPVILYNIPYRTGLDLDAGTIISLASHHNIIGLSDASENSNKIRDIVNQTRDKNFKVMAGSTNYMADYLEAGALGGFCALACVLPTEVQQIYQLWTSQKQGESKQYQHKFGAMSQALKRFGPACMKHWMDKKGQYGGPTRSPMLPLSNEEKQAVENDFRNGGFQI